MVKFVFILPLIFLLANKAEPSMLHQNINLLKPSLIPGIPTVADYADTAIYFQANGTEPQWNLAISSERIVFQSSSKGFEAITTPHVEPTRTADANVKKYSIHTDAFTVEIELNQMLCDNPNSQERFPYSVKVSVKRSIDKDYTSFSGCGLYITDVNLQGKWILQQIKSDTVTAKQFNDTLPFIELNPRGNSFSGYAGCNNISGRIFSERNLLRFTDLVFLKKDCDAQSKEKELINALQFSTHFQIEKNTLKLSNPGGLTLVFKKSD